MARLLRNSLTLRWFLRQPVSKTFRPDFKFYLILMN